jgi:hypothetical protein
MSDHFLAPAWHKAHHAERHLQALHGEVGQYLGREPFEVTNEIDVEKAEFVARLSVKEKPPVLWSLIAGDAVANLRAALDHTVCLLAEREGETVSSAHAFPILDRAPESEKQKKRWDQRLEGVGSVEEQIIASVQPYAQFSADKVGNSPLHVLRELSNEDKHRVILARYSAIPPKEGIEVRVGECRDVEPIEKVELHANKPLEDGSPVLSASVEITGPEPFAQVKADFPFDAAFGASMSRLSGLAQIRDAVCAIMLALSDPTRTLATAHQREQS